MKNLNQVLTDIKIIKIIGNTEISVKGITMDSREVEKDFMFIAINGTIVDGHKFIEKAIDNGANVIMCENLENIKINKNTTYIIVENSANALGYIASAFYEHPSRKIKLIGITGTNGKTSSVTMLYNLFKSLNKKCGLISTVSYYIDEQKLPSTHTTPDQVTLNKLLAKMVEQNCSYCFMEVSSHAIVQNRIAGLNFTGGGFTNLTHDHLDYHKDFKSYRDAKKQFFDELPENAFAISNLDDPNGTFMLQNTKASTSYYSIKKIAEYKAMVLDNSIEGLHMKIGKKEINFLLRGRFNAYNLLTVFAIADKLGIEEDILLEKMSLLKAVDGRFNTIENKKNVYAIVDYAHTPDAIENVLSTIDEIRTKNETLFVVIGCGGNRDKTKRPIMASISSKYADKIIITSDNPRNENPIDIINDMKKGLDAHSLSKALTIVDRYEAIKTACVMSKEKDIILVAGKGHETYQIIKNKKHPFDDKKIINELLNQ